MMVKLKNSIGIVFLLLPLTCLRPYIRLSAQVTITLNFFFWPLVERLCSSSSNNMLVRQQMEGQEILI